MPSRLSQLFAAAIITSAVAGCMAVSVGLAPTPITLATGTPGGLYHPVGNAICRMYNLSEQNRALPCVAINSEGSVTNIRRVANGSSTFGLSQSDVANAAFHGTGPFAAAGPDRKLRLLIALYPETFTVVARADSHIQAFPDLPGKRVGIGNSGSGYAFTRDMVLGAYGWTLADLQHTRELDPAEQNQMLCNDSVDAIIFDAGHPNGLTQGATTGCKARLISVSGPPIDRLLAAYPYYTVAIIPGGMYPGNPDDVRSIGTMAVLLTSSDQPDERAYAVVKAVFENFADFRRLHPALANLDIRTMVPSEAVLPIHPGALAYYREAGLVPE